MTVHVMAPPEEALQWDEALCDSDGAPLAAVVFHVSCEEVTADGRTGFVCLVCGESSVPPPPVLS